MFENLSRGWKVGAATRKLVFQDKRLLLYPLVSGVVSVIELAAIFGSVFLFVGFTGFSFWIGVAALIIYYPIVIFTSTYVLMAMLIAFRSFEAGERIGMRQALASVKPYSKVVVEWAIFDGIVLLIIRLIESRLGRVGSIIFGLVASISIAYATFFAVPVILDNKTGPIQTIKESTAFLTRNFGKSFGGVAFAELYSALFLVPGFILLFFGLLGGLALGSLALGLSLAIAGIVLIVFGGLLNSTLLNVLKLIIYEHANGKPLPAGFPEDVISQSIKQKGSWSNLFGGSSQTSTPAPTSSTIPNYCPNCGAQLQAGANFCPSCGSPIT